LSLAQIVRRDHEHGIRLWVRYIDNTKIVSASRPAKREPLPVAPPPVLEGPCEHVAHFPLGHTVTRHMRFADSPSM